MARLRNRGRQARRRGLWPGVVAFGFLIVVAVMLLPRQGRGPCDLIDWIGPRAQAPVYDIGPLKSYWPDRRENVEIARLHQGRAGGAGQPDPLMQRIMVDPCLLIDWRALDRAGMPVPRAGVAADGVETLRRVGIAGGAGADPGRGLRIAVRTEIEGASCAEAGPGTQPSQAKGVLVARALGAGQSRWRLFDALDRWFGRASRIDINTFIYRNAVISPKHAFASAKTRRYLIRDGAEILLVSFYVDAADQPGAGTPGLLLAEMLNLTELATRLRQSRAACRAPRGQARQGIAL